VLGAVATIDDHVAALFERATRDIFPVLAELLAGDGHRFKSRTSRSALRTITG
jgi:hypothetical protein